MEGIIRRPLPTPGVIALILLPSVSVMPFEYYIRAHESFVSISPEPYVTMNES